MRLLKTIFIKSRFLVALFLLLFSFLEAQTNVSNLLCEYHTNPIGIDIVKPRLSWQLSSNQQNLKQIAYEVRVANSIENLNKPKKVGWSSGKIVSDKSVNVEYNGPALSSNQRVYWQVKIWDNKGVESEWSQPAYWEMGILSKNEWEASWIAMEDQLRVDKLSLPAQFYRSEFTTTKKISKARAYVTSLGIYEFYLNDKKVGDELFTPGWTSYNKRLQYQVYDVTNLIEKSNGLGAIVADGWYRGNMGWSSSFGYYGNQLAFFVQIKIDYTDGSSEIIKSTNKWKVTTGPFISSDIYNGERYDARLEMAGWSKYGFDDNKWNNVVEVDHKDKNLIASQGVPVTRIQELMPIKSFTTPKGEKVLDFGQNMVGNIRMKVKGQKGDKVTIKYAEVLDKEGNFYTDNLRSAEATDTYVLKGESEEIYEPHFTFHGFRYVKLMDYPGEMDPKNFTGVVIHSEMKPTGTFVCSDSMINQLQHNIQWGQKGNFLDVPTDCPQRDERLGWTGDAQVFSPTAAFNFDVAAFYTKWMKDVAADQLPNGSVTHVVPDVLKGGSGATAWADVSVIIPWNVYRLYGDKRILVEQYASMKAWVDFMADRAGDDYLWNNEDFHFGDWLAYATEKSDYPGATTEKDLIASAYFSYSSGILSKAAEIIGKKEDAIKYKQMSEKVKKAFAAEYSTNSGRLVSHTQTAYALALAFDLVPQELRSKTAEYFAKDVEKFGHLTTGFVGTPILCSTLSSIGRDDLAFMLLNRKKYPSWLYPVTQGATTIWERWDGQKTDGTFQSTGMNSFNHYAYGAIGDWLYNHVAGISIDETNPGYKHTILYPHPGGGLTSAKAEFLSLYGKITSDWQIKDGKFEYVVEIPANTTATVILPNAKRELIMLNSTTLNSDAQQTSNEVTLDLGSGKYVFSYPYEVK